MTERPPRVPRVKGQGKGAFVSKLKGEEVGEGGRPLYLDRPPKCASQRAEFEASGTIVDFPTRSEPNLLPRPPLHSTLETEFNKTKKACLEAFSKVQDAVDKNDGKKFFDHTFFLGDQQVLYPSGSTPSDCTVAEPKRLMRILDLFGENCPVFAKGEEHKSEISFEDCQQGCVGDCFMIAGIVSLASRSVSGAAASATLATAAATGLENEEKRDGDDEEEEEEAEEPIKRILVASDPERSVYAGLFFVHGAWQWVLVDGVIAVNEEGTKPHFANCGEMAELYPVILEKLFAKSRGCWDLCDGGLTSQAIAEMCVGVEKHGITLHGEKTLKWSKFKELVNDPLVMMGCSVRPPPAPNGGGDASSSSGASGGGGGKAGEESGPEGLLYGHAYSILAAHDTKEHGSFLSLRDPYADSHEFNGKWSDNSPLWDKFPSVAKELGHKRKIGDGTFVMCLADFAKYFDVDAVQSFRNSDQILSLSSVYGRGGTEEEEEGEGEGEGDNNNEGEEGENKKKKKNNKKTSKAKRHQQKQLKKANDIYILCVGGDEDDKKGGKKKQEGEKEEKKKYPYPLQFVLGQYASRFCPLVEGLSEFSHQVAKEVEGVEWKKQSGKFSLTVNHHPNGCPLPIEFSSSTKEKIGYKSAPWAESLCVEIKEPPLGIISICPDLDEGVPYYVRVIAPPEAKLTCFQLSKGKEAIVGFTEHFKVKVEKKLKPTYYGKHHHGKKSEEEIAAAAEKKKKEEEMRKEEKRRKRREEEGSDYDSDDYYDSDDDDYWDLDDSDYWDDEEYEEDEEWGEEEEEEEEEGSDYEDSWFDSDDEDYNEIAWSDMTTESGYSDYDDEEGEGVGKYSEEELRDCFDEFDLDGSNQLEKSEAMCALLHFMPDASPAELEQKIRLADTSGDGALSFSEFKNIVKKILDDEAREEEQDDDEGEDDDDEDEDSD